MISTFCVHFNIPMRGTGANGAIALPIDFEYTLDKNQLKKNNFLIFFTAGVSRPGCPSGSAGIAQVVAGTGKTPG